jgi:hypothetical protein
MPTLTLASILQRLALAYPEKRLDKATLQIYQQELSDIPPGLLEQAVKRHIRTSPWFPHISDLRLAAHKLSGSSDFASLPASGTDFLALEAKQLEDQYFHQGEFDPEAWERLAVKLERVSRPYKAEEVRQKARHIQQAEEASQRGEQYPPAEVRRRYAERLRLG